MMSAVMTCGPCDPCDRHVTLCGESPCWNVFSFIYSRPSALLLCERGEVIHTVMSANGGKQGDVLAGLGYARLFQRIYECYNENSILDFQMSLLVLSLTTSQL